MKKKQFLSFILTICMVLTLMYGMTVPASAVSAWDGTSPAVNASYTFSGGDGSSKNPYLISTAADLAQLAVNINAGINYTNKIFCQTDDIELNSGVTFTFEADTGLVTVTNGINTFYLGTGIKGDDSGSNNTFDATAGTAGTIYENNTTTTVGSDIIGLHPWIPIGSYSHPFAGYFIGQSYAIRGIYINNTSSYRGLFGYAQGSIRNVGVANSYIRGGQYVGGIAGYTAVGNTNCYNTGIICGSSEIGGITGYSSWSYNCYNTGTVSGTSYVGGVAGISEGQLQYCYSTSTVTGTSNIGSVLGYEKWGFVLHCGTIGMSQHIIAGTSAECGGTNDGDQILLAGLTSGTSTLLEALNAWVSEENRSYYYTWKEDSESKNGGYPILDAAYVPITVPDAPTGLAATPGSGQLALTWTAPTNTGGSPITGYQVSTNNGSNWTDTGSTSTSHTVTGLTNGTSYTFKVRAVNGIGEGAASNVITATPAASPSGGSGGGGGGSSAPTIVTKIESGGNVTDANVGNLVKEGKSLTVEGKAGEKLVFDTAALKNIDEQTKNNLKVEIKDVSADYKKEHPDRLVVSLSIIAGGKHITSFGNGIATVSLPYELKAGEKAKDVTVWYLAEDGTMSEVPCTYDLGTKLATFKVNHFSLYVVGTADTASWTNPFSDVKESSWFYDAVRYVSANEMMQGTSDTTFNPSAKTTRGMIVTILWRMENEPKAVKEIAFTDVKNGKYYHDAVAWASEKGIVGGYSAGQFGPEDNITREQLAVILHNYAKFKGYNLEVSTNISTFNDSGKVHTWSKDAMSWANAEGLINGTGSNLLEPLGLAQRSQVATTLQRFMEKVAK